MAIGKFPGKLTPFFEAFFEEDYRTHTIPVKKYEPRMFMGKEVPSIATHYVWHWGGDIGFITYSWDNKPQVLVDTSSDNVLTWMPIEDTKFINCRQIHKLPEQPTQEKNIMKKEFSKVEDFKTGMYLTFGNGREGLVIKDYDTKSGTMRYVVIYTNGGFDCLDLVVGNPTYLGGLSSVGWVAVSSVFESVRKQTLIWKREEKSPEQLAYEQLQAQIADEETRHNESMKALREQAEKLKPKGI